MAFFSRDDYLAAEARKSQMQLKGLTPPPRPGVVHPPEHERLRMQSLLNAIPETQPGPNAFAIQEAMKERQRHGPVRESEGSMEVSERETLDVSEFLGDWRAENASLAQPQSLKTRLDASSGYQREIQRRRRVTPPTKAHPALGESMQSAQVAPSLRGRSLSEASISTRHLSFADITRQSDCTNITQFMDAGLQSAPALKLNATPNPATVPTFRDRIEKTNQSVRHQRNASEEESVPVFHPTPKLPATKDFPLRSSTPADGLQTEASGSKLPVKSPKKSIFSKFKLSTNSRTSNTAAASDQPPDPASHVEEQVPVKVQALLGESPRKPKGRVSLGASPTKIPRSPSKRKNFFSRKNVEFIEPPRPSRALSEHQRPPDTPSAVTSDGPQTTISDLTHYSYQAQRNDLKRESKEAKDSKKDNMDIRSQSVNLRYLDCSIPPTPPAKNTPPHEKAAKEAKEVEEMQEAMKLRPAQRQRALADGDEEVVNGTRKASDPRVGSYGYRHAPTLVTKPSMYSMHASVVPDLMEASTIEEMNARVGALDLEGFSTPPENVRRSHIAAAVYSPSIYSTNWAADAGYTKPGATPMLAGGELRESNTPSAHTKDSSSNGTIPIFYPELATDPSVATKGGKGFTSAADDSPTNRGRTHLSPELTWNRRTRSRDPDDKDSQMFADRANNDDQRHPGYDSPSTFSHASAMPSPLQYLPATTYTPAPKKSKKVIKQVEADVSQSTPSRKRAISKSARSSGLGISKGGASASSSPDRNRDPVDSKTSLRAAGNVNKASCPDLQPSRSEQPVNTDPEKHPVPLRHVPADKLDLVMEMLSKLHARNGELIDMRDEMRASTARLDQRLSAVESQHQGTPPLTPSTLSQYDGGSDGLAVSQTNHIPTDVAHEFYRSAQRDELQVEHGGESGGNTDDEEEDDHENETIRELKEANKKLLEMVGGFANKIQALEEQMKRVSA